MTKSKALQALKSTQRRGDGEALRKIMFSMPLRFCISALCFLLLLPLLILPVRAQEPAPTLVPPTLVPQASSTVTDALPTESGIAQILRSGVVRVGILFNESPFGVLDVRGNVSGFDADLARSIAQAWGVTVEFVQVTRQTAVATLVAGDVEMLLAALPHTRALDAVVEFSDTYYPTAQSMLVREGDGAVSLGDMANRRIGFVAGTRAQDALTDWQMRSGITFTPQTYLTLDQAITALVNGEIDGVVANRIRLQRTITQPGIARLLDQPVMPEPYAVAVRRQDVNLRSLVNRTLQYLEANGRLNEIHQANFNGAAYPSEWLPRWENVGDQAPRPDQFGQDIPFPQQYVVPRIQAAGTLRVAGGRDLPADAPESARRLDAANRGLVEAMAQRWRVTVTYVPGDNPLELVSSGAADLAVGVIADWNAAGRVDFTGTYFQHGAVMMVPANSTFGGFGDLRGRIVGVFADEPGAAERVVELAEAERAILRGTFSILREQDAAFGMLVDNNYNAVFGDSLRIIPLLQAQPNDLRLWTRADGTTRWFSRIYLHFAVPRNDIDFRLLVEYTLQELSLDGGLAASVVNATIPGSAPAVDIWPGARDYLGYHLGNQG